MADMKKNKDGSTTIEHEVCTLTTHVDGSITVSNEFIAGSVQPDGTAKMRLLKQLRSIAVENIMELDSHEIRRDNARAIHKLTFLNGGRVELMYANDGTIEELSTSRVVVAITKDGLMSLKMDDKKTALN